MNESASASLIQLVGAGGFGAIIGWYGYYINRYRGGDVQLSDIVTLVGILGGGAVLAIFPARTDLFGAYGIGLCVGFFSYFVLLWIWVGEQAHQHRRWHCVIVAVLGCPWARLAPRSFVGLEGFLGQ